MEACHVPDMQETPAPPDTGVQIAFLEANLPPAIPSPATSFPPMPWEVLSCHWSECTHCSSPFPLLRAVQETRGTFLETRGTFLQFPKAVPKTSDLRASGNEVLGCLLAGCPHQVTWVLLLVPRSVWFLEECLFVPLPVPRSASTPAPTHALLSVNPK